MKSYRICTRCVMDTTDAEIVFDENGVCDHCVTFTNSIAPYWQPNDYGEENLSEIVGKIKKSGRKKDFDCIIGMSGGVDSSYLVYLAKEKFGLNPLVFHVDAGWNSNIAVQNIENIVDRLNLDLYTEVINWEEMKDLQLAFFKSSVSHLDTPQDHAFFATMYKFANKYDIKYILTGGNYSTECVRNPKEWMYFQSDSTQIKDIHKKFGSRPLSTFPLTNILWHKFYLPYIKGIKLIRPLDFVPYVKEDAVKVLVDKFDYQCYDQKHFESRFTKFYEGYWLPEKFGFDTRKVQFSSLILTGQMSRDEALEKLQKPALCPEDVRQEFQYVASKLDVSTNVLQSYFDTPNKSFRDYKNQQFIYNIGSRVLRFLRIEKGGKR